jgi:hypothetical protein
MTSPEYIRFPDAYEATLRRWADMMRLPAETGWNKSIAFHRRDAAFAGMMVWLTTLTKQDVHSKVRGRIGSDCGYFSVGFGNCPDCSFRARLAFISRWRC